MDKMGTLLTSSKGDEYPKLIKIGDKVKGRFDGYRSDVPGKFGIEKLATMTGDRGQRMIVKATTTLAPTIEENLDRLLGKQVTITLVELRPTLKGSAMKIYSVEVEDDDDPPPPDNYSPADDAGVF